MNNIEVRILNANFDGMSIFLARLTQRGQQISSMSDLIQLYNNCINKVPSEHMLSIPHTTLRRMNYMTVAIVGLSTKAVSQLRTHAKRLTFVSTSTQYSAFTNKNNNFVIPDCDAETQQEIVKAYEIIQDKYDKLIANGVNKDIASYILPQGLRKSLIISGNLDDWQYVMRTRLCNRNTREVQYIMQLIYNKIVNVYGEEFVANMLPNCVYDKCLEGKFSCGKKYGN